MEAGHEDAAPPLGGGGRDGGTGGTMSDGLSQWRKPRQLQRRDCCADCGADNGGVGGDSGGSGCDSATAGADSTYSTF